MDVQRFWDEALARWPSLQAKIESRRGPTHDFFHSRDPWAVSTTIRYQDGPPRDVMRRLVAELGGDKALVIRQFSVGMRLWALDTGQPVPVRFSRDATLELDLTSDEVVEAITARNDWAAKALPSDWDREHTTVEALKEGLSESDYPFADYLMAPASPAAPPPSTSLQQSLPIAVVDAQEEFTLFVDDNDLEQGHGQPRTDGVPVLVNATDRPIYLLLDGEQVELAYGYSPSPSAYGALHDTAWVSSGESAPVTRLQIGSTTEGLFGEDVPPAREGIWYVVPWQAIREFPDRDDFVVACCWRMTDKGVVSMDNPSLFSEDPEDPESPDPAWVLTALMRTS